MPIQEVPQIGNQQMIFDLLNAARKAGIISDFLLRWRGSARRLSPKITVWTAASAAREGVRDQLVRLLNGFVGSAQIVMLEE